MTKKPSRRTARNVRKHMRPVRDRGAGRGPRAVQRTGYYPQSLPKQRGCGRKAGAAAVTLLAGTTAAVWAAVETVRGLA